ncbi:diguanylate cyclase [Xylophilus rhododendri]|uniref:diguanylate cyclase n=1 Tax=Xylophilus rhododendri TaxID=2697032 RepID=A0A857JDI3_9BURK|nr:sensor domain-containing diguanylate cyclase [Xylophilus rhododendri]QHJ00726.1 diguanylate cyclase [Xylophilus rhododendri]
MPDSAGRLPALQDDLAHLRDLLDHNSDWVWEVDAQGRYTYCSAMVMALLGRPPQEVLGKTPFDFMPPAEAARVGQAFGAIVAAARPFSGLVNRNQRPDGSIVVLETSGIPLFDAQGQLRGYRGIDRDISALGERVLQLEAVYDTAPVALCTVDRLGVVAMANQAMAQLLGRPAAELPGLRLSDVMPEAVHQLGEDFALADLDALPQLPSHEFEWKGRWFYATPHVLRDALGAVAGMSMAWMDITARKQAEQQLTEANLRLEQYARQDYLTGLYNRRYLDERLEREIARARREAGMLSVCMVDVDHFKAYNDSRGHLAGDACLRAVAHTLAQHVTRPGDLVSRYGGEEFVVVLADTDEQGAQRVAERVRSAVEALALPHPDAPSGRVTVSVGVVSCWPGNDAPDVDSLLRAADQALYEAKRGGRNRVAAGRCGTA